MKYTAAATSRFKEYFPENQKGGFTRTSEEIVVDVPASSRPLAPEIVYVIPTFGWERQIDTNLKRSVRFGGGLRVYMRRPWFSSGEGELLGVTLWSYSNGLLMIIIETSSNHFLHNGEWIQSGKLAIFLGPLEL